MRKSLIPVVLAACVLQAGSSSVLCFAADDANPKPVASPQTRPQALQQKTHRPPQKKAQQPSQRKMHRMQKGDGDKPVQSDSAATSTQGQPEEAPNPSQRSMRQKLKEATPKQTPAPSTR